MIDMVVSSKTKIVHCIKMMGTIKISDKVKVLEKNREPTVRQF